ncbi:MAG: hypothetical protein WDA28_13040 [Castellaniella sp.]
MTKNTDDNRKAEINVGYIDATATSPADDHNRLTDKNAAAVWRTLLRESPWKENTDFDEWRRLSDLHKLPIEMVEACKRLDINGLGSALQRRNDSCEGDLRNLYIEFYARIVLQHDLVTPALALPHNGKALPSCWPGIDVTYEVVKNIAYIGGTGTDMTNYHYAMGNLNEEARLRGEDIDWPAKQEYVNIDTGDGDSSCDGGIDRWGNKSTLLPLPKIGLMPPRRLTEYANYDELIEAEYAIDEAEHAYRQYCSTIDSESWPYSMVGLKPATKAEKHLIELSRFRDEEARA